MFGAGQSFVKEGNTATFKADVIEASRKNPVIVDFWAPWCGPCKQLGPVLEKLVNQAQGKVTMVKINVDNNQELAMQLRVQSVPMVYAFKDGRVVDGFVGAQPESQVKSFVQRLLGGGSFSVDEALAEAAVLLKEGDPESASAIYSQILSQEPVNPQAFAGLLRCLMQAGEIDTAKQMLAQVPKEIANHAEILAVKTALELLGQTKNAAPTADLRRRLAQNEDDHQARFDLALAYYAGGEKEAAVDELLELYRRDKTWNEEAARTQLVKFFEAFGHSDPITVAGRKKLSRLMFA